jgi:NADPH:quinone reductase-like Zn-dependent oxidoreductase
VSHVASQLSVLTFGKVFSRVPEAHRGTIAEYALSTASATARKPKSIGFSEAASIPLAALTAFQSLQEGDTKLEGGLRGKTVYVPAGLSGTGLFAVQLAKNVFGASKVISTLSTGKIPLIKELMGVNAPDLIIDYTKDDVNKKIGAKTVDFMFDTMGGTLGALPVMKKGGMIVSVSTVPSGTAFKKFMPETPTWMVYILNFVHFVFTRLAGWRGVKFESLFMHASAEDLEKIGQWTEEGKIKPVVGNKVKLSDITGLREGCQQILDGKVRSPEENNSLLQSIHGR